MAEWWRSWHGAPTDAKWLVVAKRAKVLPGVVSALWYALQDYASQATPRGSIAGFDIESYAAWSGWDEDDLWRVMKEFEKPRKGPDGGQVAGVINNRELTAWAVRQPKREDWSTDRVRKHREAKSINDNVPADTVPTVPPSNETPSNALKRTETIEQNITEEIEESRTEQRDTEASLLVQAPFAHTREKNGAADSGQPDPVDQMRGQLATFIAEHCPEQRRTSFAAAANPIIDGLSSATWAGPDGGQIPATDRPRLLALALAKCAAESQFGSNSLHSTLRYVIPQQMDPHPIARARPAFDSQAARVRNEMPGRDRQHEVGGVGLRGLDDWEWSETHKRFMPKGIA